MIKVSSMLPYATLVSKRKAEGFTILGTLNPLITSKTESQSIIDLFDGIIEIYARELRERARRLLVVKKMYGRISRNRTYA